jgi:hypothetical protein
MFVVLQKCDVKCFHGNDNVYMASDVLSTATAECGYEMLYTDITGCNEGAPNALICTTTIHLFLPYHVSFCMIVFFFLAIEQTIKSESCCGVILRVCS